MYIRINIYIYIYYTCVYSDKSGNEQDCPRGRLPYELIQDYKVGLMMNDCSESTQLSPLTPSYMPTDVSPLMPLKDDATLLNESDKNKEDDMIKISSSISKSIDALSQSSQSIQAPLAPHISTISSISLPSFLPSSLQADDAEIARGTPCELASQSLPSVLTLLEVNNVDLIPFQPPSNVTDKLCPKDNQTDDSKLGFFKLLNHCRIGGKLTPTLHEEKSGGGEEVGIYIYIYIHIYIFFFILIYMYMYIYEYINIYT
jgi:hypothetical protein